MCKKNQSLLMMKSDKMARQNPPMIAGAAARGSEPCIYKPGTVTGLHSMSVCGVSVQLLFNSLTICFKSHAHTFYHSMCIY